MRSETEVLTAEAGERRQDSALASLRLQHFPDSYTYFIDFTFKLAFSSDRVDGPILIVRTLPPEKDDQIRHQPCVPFKFPAAAKHLPSQHLN